MTTWKMEKWTEETGQTGLLLCGRSLSPSCVQGNRIYNCGVRSKLWRFFPSCHSLISEEMEGKGDVLERGHTELWREQRGGELIEAMHHSAKKRDAEQERRKDGIIHNLLFAFAAVGEPQSWIQKEEEETAHNDSFGGGRRHLFSIPPSTNKGRPRLSPLSPLMIVCAFEPFVVVVVAATADGIDGHLSVLSLSLASLFKWIWGVHSGGD